MTYIEARDKIWNAYFMDEIKPMNSTFCFCGTLSPDSNWGYRYNDKSKYPYSIDEYRSMEAQLLDICGKSYGWYLKLVNEIDYEKYEDDLFIGMLAALEVLRDIHRKRGENVDDLPALTKRKLVVHSSTP